jgi:hypothetical protein
MKIKANIDITVDKLRPLELDYWPSNRLLHILRQDKRHCPENLCDPESKNDCTFYTYSGAPEILATVEPLTENYVPPRNRTVTWGKVYRTVHREHPAYKFARTDSYKSDNEYQPSPGEQDWNPTYEPRVEEFVGFIGDYYHGHVLSTYDKGVCIGGTTLSDRPVTILPLTTDGKIKSLRAVVGVNQYVTYEVRTQRIGQSTSYFEQFAKYDEVKRSALRTTSKKYLYQGPVGNWQQLPRAVLVRIIEGIPPQVKPVPRVAVKHTLVEQLRERHEKKPKLSAIKVQTSIKRDVEARSPVKTDTEDERKPAARKL